MNLKNILKSKSNTKLTNEKFEKANCKILKKCNDKLLNFSYQNRDIYLKIDEFNNNGKKTIAYFIDNFYPNIDGVLMVLENYVNYMKNYFNIVVCAPRSSTKIKPFDKYFVLFTDAIKIKSIGYCMAFPQFDTKFKNFISHLKIDLIHIQSPFNMGQFAIALAKKRHIPCISTFHSQYKRDFLLTTKSETFSNILLSIIMKVYNKSTLVLTMNEFSKNVLLEYGLKNKVEILENATNLLRQDFNKDEEELILNKNNLNDNTFKLIYIGRMVKVKNVYLILNVILKLSKMTNNFKCIFMGDGPELSKIKEFSKTNNLDKFVIFLGKITNQEEKSIIIKNSNLLFFPSEYDTDGIVKMECACYDVPSLCISNTGAASTIIDNLNGFLTTSNIDEISNRLFFLVKNVDFVKNIGKNANLTIYKTWDNVCSKLKSYYDCYLNKNKLLYLKHLKKSNK